MVVRWCDFIRAPRQNAARIWVASAPAIVSRRTNAIKRTGGRPAAIFLGSRTSEFIVGTHAHNTKGPTAMSASKTLADVCLHTLPRAGGRPALIVIQQNFRMIGGRPAGVACARKCATAVPVHRWVRAPIGMAAWLKIRWRHLAALTIECVTAMWDNLPFHSERRVA